MKHKKTKKRGGVLENTDERVRDIKGPNIHVFGIPEVQRRGNGAEVIYEELKSENFPELIKSSGHRFKPKQVKYKETHTWIHQ